jgi:S-adenosylmethionine decarboxylase
VELTGGCEWVVEAHGCNPAALSDLAALEDLFLQIVNDLQLHPVAIPAWHQFPAPGGITGVTMLRESHLACHTFPEHRSVCLNLFCCVPRREWDFSAELRKRLGAESVQIRRIDRPYCS